MSDFEITVDTNPIPASILTPQNFAYPSESGGGGGGSGGGFTFSLHDFRVQINRILNAINDLQAAVVDLRVSHGFGAAQFTPASLHAWVINYGLGIIQNFAAQHLNQYAMVDLPGFESGWGTAGARVKTTVPDMTIVNQPVHVHL